MNEQSQKKFYMKVHSAEQLDWSKIRWFKQEEFPLDELGLLNKQVVEELNKVREALGVPIVISPVEGAVIRYHSHSSGVRNERRSYHYFDEYTGRLGLAVDVFIMSLIPYVSPIQIISRVFGCSRFKGLGMYCDALLNNENKLMLHLDLRPTDPLVWIGKRRTIHNKREYFYPSTHDDFLIMLDKEFKDLKLKDMTDDELCVRPKGTPESHEA